jgi:hypothetical protein
MKSGGFLNQLSDHQLLKKSTRGPKRLGTLFPFTWWRKYNQLKKLCGFVTPRRWKSPVEHFNTLHRTLVRNLHTSTICFVHKHACSLKTLHRFRAATIHAQNLDLLHHKGYMNSRANGRNFSAQIKFLPIKTRRHEVVSQSGFVPK